MSTGGGGALAAGQSGAAGVVGAGNGGAAIAGVAGVAGVGGLSGSGGSIIPPGAGSGGAAGTAGAATGNAGAGGGGSGAGSSGTAGTGGGVAGTPAIVLEEVSLNNCVGGSIEAKYKAGDNFCFLSGTLVFRLFPAGGAAVGQPMVRSSKSSAPKRFGSRGPKGGRSSCSVARRCSAAVKGRS